MNADKVYNMCYGFYSDIGKRTKMEDRSTVCPDFAPARAGLFGIFDGHGGEQVAEHCSNRLAAVLKEELDLSNWEWESSLQKTFLKLDGEVTATLPADIGSTAIVAIVTPTLIVVANIGDSRAVLCRATDAVALSSDHKPDRPDELARIQAAGGYVIEWEGCSRIYGVLAVSRSIGDASMKPSTTAEPDIQVSIRQDDDEFLILASDGLWDVFNNSQVVALARKYLNYWYKKNSKPDQQIESAEYAHDPAAQATANFIAKEARKKGSKDNLSIIIIDMRGPPSRRR